jgi:hypothetical protein
MVRALGRFGVDAEDAPAFSGEPLIARRIVLFDVFKFMNAAVDFDSELERPDGKVDGQPGYRMLAAYGIAFLAQEPKRLPGLLFRRVRSLTSWRARLMFLGVGIGFGALRLS